MAIDKVQSSINMTWRRARVGSYDIWGSSTYSQDSRYEKEIQNYLENILAHTLNELNFKAVAQYDGYCVSMAKFIVMPGFPPTDAELIGWLATTINELDEREDIKYFIPTSSPEKEEKPEWEKEAEKTALTFVVSFVLFSAGYLLVQFGSGAISTILGLIIIFFAFIGFVCALDKI